MDGGKECGGGHRPESASQKQRMASLGGERREDIGAAAGSNIATRRPYRRQAPGGDQTQQTGRDVSSTAVPSGMRSSRWAPSGRLAIQARPCSARLVFSNSYAAPLPHLRAHVGGEAVATRPLGRLGCRSGPRGRACLRFTATSGGRQRSRLRQCARCRAQSRVQNRR